MILASFPIGRISLPTTVIILKLGLPEGKVIHLMFEEHLEHADHNRFLGVPVLVFNPEELNLFVWIHQAPKRDVIDAHLERGVESNGCCQLLSHFGQGCGSWGSYNCSGLTKEAIQRSFCLHGFK